jgi:hypothetical protein
MKRHYVWWRPGVPPVNVVICADADTALTEARRLRDAGGSVIMMEGPDYTIHSPDVDGTIPAIATGSWAAGRTRYTVGLMPKGSLTIPATVFQTGDGNAARGAAQVLEAEMPGRVVFQIETVWSE